MADRMKDKIYEKPKLKRYIQRINSSGDIVEIIDFDDKPHKERADALEIVFTQGLNRLGYKQETNKEKSSSSRYIK